MSDQKRIPFCQGQIQRASQMKGRFRKCFSFNFKNKKEKIQLRKIKTRSSAEVVQDLYFF